MTLDDLKRQNKDFYIFFSIFDCDTHFMNELRWNR